MFSISRSGLEICSRVESTCQRKLALKELKTCNIHLALKDYISRGKFILLHTRPIQAPGTNVTLYSTHTRVKVIQAKFPYERRTRQRMWLPHGGLWFEPRMYPLSAQFFFLEFCSHPEGSSPFSAIVERSGSEYFQTYHTCKSGSARPLSPSTWVGMFSVFLSTACRL